MGRNNTTVSYNYLKLQDYLNNKLIRLEILESDKAGFLILFHYLSKSLYNIRKGAFC